MEQILTWAENKGVGYHTLGEKENKVFLCCWTAYNNRGSRSTCEHWIREGCGNQTETEFQRIRTKFSWCHSLATWWPHHLSGTKVIIWEKAVPGTVFVSPLKKHETTSR